MFKNYLTIALRNIFKRRFFSSINIIGLAIGMAIFLLIMQFVMYEYSYDKFHTNFKNIYRIGYYCYDNKGEKIDIGSNYSGTGPALLSEFPEVKNYARIHGNMGVVSYKDKKFNNDSRIFVDASFFDIFSFPVLNGISPHVLDEPNTVMVSQSTAKKYFGEEEPIGQILQFSNEWYQYTCIVNGVFEDFPSNSDFHIDIAISFQTLFKVSGDWMHEQEWQKLYYPTYILLKPNADREFLEAKFSQILPKYTGNEQLKQGFYLERLKELHLSPRTMSTIYFMIIIASIILIIAWINFINLTTARSLERIKEVAIRKVVGGFRPQIIKQFLTESLILNLFACILAITLSEPFSVILNRIFRLRVDGSLYGNLLFWVFFLVLFMISSIISGLYPAILISSFKPIVALNGKLDHSKSGIILRKGFIIFQFAVCIIFLTGVLTVHKQIRFMQSKDPGMNIENKIGFRAPLIGITSDEAENKLNIFKNDLLSSGKITGISGSDCLPGLGYRSSDFVRINSDKSDNWNDQFVANIDYNFIPIYQLEFLAGRNFSEDFTGDNYSIIINESSLKILGFENASNAINHEIFVKSRGVPFNIIGVLKNYHHLPIRNDYHPAVYILKPIGKSFFTILLPENNQEEAITFIKNEWNKLFPDNVFDFFRLEDILYNVNSSERYFARMFGVFSILAIVIACMGLLGLSIFEVAQRTKEIGIRKALGANIGNIIIILSKDFLKVIAYANIITLPLSIFLINKWLNNYAFKSQISVELFLIPAILVIGIGLLTISYNVIKASIANPVERLKYE